MAVRRTARKAVLGFALGAAWVMAAPIALAQLNLQWDAPPGCPRRSDVLDRIRALAGSSLDKAEGLSAEGRIAQVDGRFYLTLLVRDGPDLRKRVIVSDSCADLAGAAAIALALLLGVDVNATWPGALGEGAPSEGAADRGQEERQSDDLRAEQSAEKRGGRSEERSQATRAESQNAAALGDSTSTRRWALLLRAPIVAGDLGPLPGPSLGVGLGVGMRYESWRFLVAGYAFRGQTIDAMEPGRTFGAGVDLERMTGELVTCRGWRSSRFEVAPCVGLALEYVTARGFGQGVSPESRRAVWVAASAGAALHWYVLKSLALFGGVTGYLELSRPRLVIEGLGEVRQLAPAAVGATVGVEWIL